MVVLLLLLNTYDIIHIFVYSIIYGQFVYSEAPSNTETFVFTFLDKGVSSINKY